MKSVSASIACLLIGSCQSQATDILRPEQNPPSEEPKSSDVRTVLELDETKWEFSSADEDGVKVQWQRGDERGEYVLTDNGFIHHVTDIDAAANRYRNDAVGIAIGIASLDESGNSIEYRMAYCSPGKGKVPSPYDWLVSQTLITAPSKAPFQTLSIAIDYSDSVTLTLQRHHRPRGKHGQPDGIETHVFVNNCPPAEFDHYHFQSNRPIGRKQFFQSDPQPLAVTPDG